ncbi:hypothetical protein C8T65DRAFT_653272 [Cerioporus squamosus]|nr:hypothetical protein C8T65DRAFT_653272 [Cerioporus squamosus]
MVHWRSLGTSDTPPGLSRDSLNVRPSQPWTGHEVDRTCVGRGAVGLVQAARADF